MTIGELSRRTGLPCSTIRYYERRRLLPRPPRVSGRRAFDDGAVAHLAVVRLALSAGFTLEETRRLVNDFGRDRWRSLARTKLDEVRASAQRLKVMRVLLEKLLDCACPDVEFCGRVIGRAVTSARPPARPGARRRAARSSPVPR